MKWKPFFTRVKSFDAEQARAYMDEAPLDDFIALDVRQPQEYESGRLPGAVLIPLPELPDRLDEIDPEKKIIVY
ncbi:Rhodanese-like domain-containing protein [Candidatus Desulfarcum epimagneticum]|uniref:Rhodanese-like domain-containing protein n=1 Tax=uncultured Desulfobacteraceae bacterium TaxID=218296 RepID=A0A484HHY1_9BACT|nr:Rhodanese-like domain-containing protein [uncultured Desulfobacteraceae bacterium]